MNTNRPITTLFLIMSLDGKISTGDNDDMDFDRDLPRIPDVNDGLYQYYELEGDTDLYSLNTGRVMAKVGANEEAGEAEQLPVSFIFIDNKPHLKLMGIENFIKKSKRIYIITNNKHHPAFDLEDAENLEILFYENGIDFRNLFTRLKKDFGIDRVTIQSGGTLNSALLREGLIDRISLVIAPCLIGGKDTPTLMDGESLHSVEDLHKIKVLKLKECNVLNGSYIHLLYDVLNYS